MNSILERLIAVFHIERRKMAFQKEACAKAERHNRHGLGEQGPQSGWSRCHGCIAESG